MEIRHWEEKDKEWLKDSIREFLRAGLERGGDLLDTDKNIEAYLKLGYAAVARGEPCLIAIQDGFRAGFVFWIGIPNPQLDERWRTIQALGSYTVPNFRSWGIADRLRLSAREMAKKLGFERISGPVHVTNEKGIKVFEAFYGAKINVHNFEQFI